MAKVGSRSESSLTSNSTTPALLSKLAYETAKLGPITLAYMGYCGTPYLLRGIVPNGAHQTIAAVDRERQATIAQIVATMVKMGYAELVAAMTSGIVHADRADVVAKITLELMAAAELDALTAITRKMVERGEISEANTIGKAMADHGHQEFLEMIAKENLPEPVQKAKEHVDNAVAWVTGKEPPKDPKLRDENEEGTEDKGREEEGQQLTSASIA